MYPIPGWFTWMSVLLPTISVTIPGFGGSIGATGSIGSIGVGIANVSPQYPKPDSLIIILLTSPSLTIASACAPVPCPVLSIIETAFWLVYPLPPFNTSIENILVLFPTTAFNIAPDPFPVIKTLGGIHLG